MTSVGVLTGALLSSGVLTIDARRFGGDMNHCIIVLYYRHERKVMRQGAEVQTAIILLIGIVLYCTVKYRNTVVTEEAHRRTAASVLNYISLVL